MALAKAILRSESRTAPPNGKTVKNIGYLGDGLGNGRQNPKFLQKT